MKSFYLQLDEFVCWLENKSESRWIPARVFWSIVLMPFAFVNEILFYFCDESRIQRQESLKEFRSNIQDDDIVHYSSKRYNVVGRVVHTYKRKCIIEYGDYNEETCQYSEYLFVRKSKLFMPSNETITKKENAKRSK